MREKKYRLTLGIAPPAASAPAAASAAAQLPPSSPLFNDDIVSTFSLSESGTAFTPPLVAKGKGLALAPLVALQLAAAPINAMVSRLAAALVVAMGLAAALVVALRLAAAVVKGDVLFLVSVFVEAAFDGTMKE